MTFVHPAYLLLLVFPLALGWWSVRRRGTGMRMPFDHETHVGRPWLGAWLRGVELLPAVILAMTVVLIARPQTLRVPQRDRVATHITVCMDVSGSMGAGMGDQNRYQSAAAAIESFTYARQGDAIGLTLFGSWPLRWVPLTKDLQVLRNALVFANPSNQPRGMGGTMIGSALKYCADNMQRESARLEGGDQPDQDAAQWRQQRAAAQLFGSTPGRTGGAVAGVNAAGTDRLLILVSDGASGDLNGQDQIEAISQELIAAGITMYHVHIGSDTIPDQVSSIAQETGGDAFLATNPGGLQLIFDHIDRMQPARFKATASVPVDYFEPFALVAIVAVGLYALSLLKWRYTPW